MVNQDTSRGSLHRAVRKRYWGLPSVNGNVFGKVSTSGPYSLARPQKEPPTEPAAWRQGRSGFWREYQNGLNYNWLKWPANIHVCTHDITLTCFFWIIPLDTLLEISFIFNLFVWNANYIPKDSAKRKYNGNMQLWQLGGKNKKDSAKR